MAAPYLFNIGRIGSAGPLCGFLFGTFAVLIGSGAFDLTETFGKIGQRAEADLLGDLGQAEIGACKQRFGLGNAALHQVVDGGDLILVLERVGQVILVYVGNLRQLVQGNAFAVIFIDISFCSGTLLALGGRRGEAQRNPVRRRKPPAGRKGIF